MGCGDVCRLGRYRVVFPLGLVKVEEELSYFVDGDRIVLKAGNHFVYELSLSELAKFILDVLSKSSEFREFVKNITKEIVKEMGVDVEKC